MDAATLAAALGAVRAGDAWIADCFACKGAGTLTLRCAATPEDDPPNSDPAAGPRLVLACTACAVPELLAAALAEGLLAEARPLTSESVAALIARDTVLPPPLLAPALPQSGLALIQGGRATGKTWLALGLGWALAAGGSFAGWTAPQPRRVAIVDGETPLATLQARLAALRAGGARGGVAGSARIVAADLMPGGIPDLATAAGQIALERAIGEVDCIVLDDLSTLAGHAAGRAGRPALLRDWLLRCRRRGVAVVAFDRLAPGRMAVANDAPTAAVFDAIATLVPVADDPRPATTRFTLAFEKARAAPHGLPPPIAVEMSLAGGALHCSASPPPASVGERAAALRAAGWTQRRIAAALGLSQPTVSRALGRAGRLNE